MGSVVLAAPVGRDGAYRSAISLHFPNDAHLSPADLTLLSHVCRHLGIILLAGHAAALQNDLVGLYSRAVDDDTDLLYQQVLDMAIQRVPGAERGSLLVRRSDLEPFRYVAVCGFEFEELRPITFTDQQMRNWYANDDKEWRQGRTRVLRSTELDIATFSRLAVGADQPARAGDLHDLRSNACLPVPYQGHVLAVLNLDNFTRDDAFAQDSLNTLAMFGPTVASLLAGAQYRDEIVRASRTDPLTGLANREGFRPVLERQHARSAYAGTPYTILSMDLTGFKAVNDRLGHGAGDAALVSVARALESATRPGDTVSRWGGDEFVALLPDTASAEAATVVDRLIAAVGDLAVQDLRLGVDIGAASYLEDSRNVEDLLRLSDARMYLSKQAGKAR